MNLLYCCLELGLPSLQNCEEEISVLYKLSRPGYFVTAVQNELRQSHFKEQILRITVPLARPWMYQGLLV